jgi:hypothetical protein
MKKFLILGFVFFISNGAFAQSEIDKVTETVKKSTIEGHIYFLADDLLKGRETGTPENKIAASYLANTFRGYGVKPNPLNGTYYQQVHLKKVSPPAGILFVMDGVEYKKKVAMQQGKIEYNGEVVNVGFGLEDDYKNKDVQKKLVLVKGGSSTDNSARGAFGLRKRKEELAKAAGALGIIELVKIDERVWSYIEHELMADRLEVETKESKMADDDSELPYLWVQDEYGSLTLDTEKKPTVPVKFEMTRGKSEKIISQNVIGIVEGTDPKLKNEYIIYSAHYDHVGVGSPDATGDVIYNGARDNAVGTTTVLSMAQNLVKYPTKRSALFILFTGEEKGLLGSKYYVENPVLPLNKMVYCFNSDNGGYNDTSLATIIGLERTTAEKNIIEAAKAFGLKAIEDPAPEQGLFDRSDNVHFAAKGIPAPTFSMGFSSFDGEVTKYYHQPGDHADNMDYNYLEKFFRAYVLAGRNIANDANTPVWVAGDKYEAAGKQLYGN